MSKPGSEAYELPYKFLQLNPYTGEKIAALTKWEVSLGRENILNFILSLHNSLALGRFGAYILWITALLWTIDCFVGFYLTLPRGRRRSVRSFSHREKVGMRGYITPCSTFNSPHPNPA